MSEAIARLTRTVEEKDLQITALINRLEMQDDEKPDLKVNPLKREANEEEAPPVQKVKEEQELDQVATLMGSFSIYQL